MEAFAHEGAALVDVAAEDGDGADADGQREERLVHGGRDHAGGDFVKVRNQVEPKPLRRAGKRRGFHRQHHHQHEQGGEHHLCDGLQPLLELEGEDEEAQRHGKEHIPRAEDGAGRHPGEAEAPVTAQQEGNRIVHHPARDHGVKRHEADVAEEGHIAVETPCPLPGGQGLIHPHGARLGRPADGKLHGHHRNAQKQQADGIQQHKRAAAVLPHHPRELPDVSAADGAACAQHDEAQPGADLFSAHVSPPPFCRSF